MCSPQSSSPVPCSGAWFPGPKWKELQEIFSLLQLSWCTSSAWAQEQPGSHKSNPAPTGIPGKDTTHDAFCTQLCPTAAAARPISAGSLLMLVWDDAPLQICGVLYGAVFDWRTALLAYHKAWDIVNSPKWGSRYKKFPGVTDVREKNWYLS